MIITYKLIIYFTLQYLQSITYFPLRIHCYLINYTSFIIVILKYTNNYYTDWPIEIYSFKPVLCT